MDPLEGEITFVKSRLYRLLSEAKEPRNGNSSFVYLGRYVVWHGCPGSERRCAFLVGPPASDVLGSEDLWGNPTFVGGVANGGSTSHGIW